MPLQDDIGLVQGSSPSARSAGPAPQPGLGLIDDIGLSNQPAGQPTQGQPEQGGSVFSPDGLLSPENLGMFGGGMLGGAAAGGMAGAATGPLAPLAVPLGAILGAGTGAMLGRAGELMANPEDLPAGKLVEELGLSSQRGMQNELLGQVSGQVLSAGVQKILAPFAARIDPGIATLRNKTSEMVQAAMKQARIKAGAEEFDIPLTASQATGKKALAQLEAMPARFPSGVEPVANFIDAQIGRAQQAVIRLADDIAPGTSRDLTLVGQYAKDQAAGRLEVAQAAASRLYSRIGRLFKPEATFPASHLQQTASEIAQQEAKLAGVQSQVANKAGQIVESLTPGTPNVSVGGQAIDPASLPASLVKQFGLDQPRQVDFQTLRTIQSRLGALMDSTTNREARRQYAQLFGAVSRDIDAIGQQVPALQPMLEKANQFYKVQVAQRFYDNAAKKIVDQKDATALAGILLSPRSTPEAIQRAKAVVGPKAWKQLSAAWLDDLASRQAVNTQTQEFSVVKFLTATSPQNYSPKVLDEILGTERASEFGRLRDVLSAMTISRLLGANPSETARGLLGSGQLMGTLYLGLQGLLTGNPTKLVEAGGLQVAPKLIGKLLYSPAGIRWLSEGIKLQPGTREALVHAGRLPVVFSRVGDRWPFPVEGVGEEIHVPESQPNPATGVTVEMPQ